MRLIYLGLLLAMPVHESPVAAEESPGQTTFRRIPENDAANCLYLQLRLLGYSDGYEVFRNELPADHASLTLQEMAAIGRRLGFRLEPVKMTVSELLSARCPVILHFESRGVDAGRLMLFLWMYGDETKLSLIDGAHVSFTEMSRDEFRRSWNGYALIVRPPIEWGVRMRRGAAILVWAGLCFWWASQGGRSGGRFEPLRFGFKPWGSKRQACIGGCDALSPDD